MRIAIVNDSALAVETLRRAVKGVEGCDVAWVAQDGEEAVQKCAADTPSLILMDLMMPVMNGVEATRQIMKASPCAILLVTSSVDAHYREVFDAMSHGALDAVNTPAPGQEASLVRRINLVKSLANPVSAAPSRSPATRILTRDTRPPLLTIGASTGGPNAVATVLSGLGRDLKCAIVVIQHVAVEFAPGLATWLGEKTGLPVSAAKEGDAPEAGRVYVAASNDHLVINSALLLHYTREPLDYPYRPSVDVFFRSLVKYWPERGTAVLLTGMGRDGAEGLLALKTAGWRTLAQDKESCVVYGMPKAAAELGAASQVLTLNDIAPAILKRHAPVPGTGSLPPGQFPPLPSGMFPKTPGK